MSLQTKIKDDLKVAMKAKDGPRKDAIRVIMGEFGREVKKELADAEVVKILKKLIKSERETLQRQGGQTDSAFLAIVENYLPQQISPADIESWIRENIDFSQYKNRMQAMREIMQHFGPAADGAAVKQILQNLTP